MLLKFKPCIRFESRISELDNEHFNLFCSPEAIQLSDLITNVDILKKNIKKNKDLKIGAAKKIYISSELRGNRLNQKEIDKFYNCVCLH